MHYLFKTSKEKEENDNQFIFKISYMEIYLDNIIDLLNPKTEEKVVIREDEKENI